MPRQHYKTWPALDCDAPRNRWVPLSANTQPVAVSPRLTHNEAVARLLVRGELTDEEAAALWTGKDCEATRERLGGEGE